MAENINLHSLTAVVVEKSPVVVMVAVLEIDSAVTVTEASELFL